VTEERVVGSEVEVQHPRHVGWFVALTQGTNRLTPHAPSGLLLKETFKPFVQQVNGSAVTPTRQNPTCPHLNTLPLRAKTFFDLST